MKQTIIILFFLLCLLPNKIVAVQIVTDPKAYVHMINYISKIEEQLEKANEMIRDTKEMKKDFSKVRTNLTTIYNNTFGIVGQLDSLAKEFKEIPASMTALVKEFISYTNCIITDIKEASKIETLRKAKYYRKTPKKHYFNYGTDPKAKTKEYEILDKEGLLTYELLNDKTILGDKFGSNTIQQFEERPCGLVATFEDDIKIIQTAYNAVDTKVKKHIEKFYSEDGAEKFSKKLDKMEKELKKKNVSVAQIQSMSRDLLADIYIEIQSMNDLLHLMSNHILANQIPSQLSKKLTNEQKDNINSLTNPEIYENQNVDNFLDKINSKYSNEKFEGLPF